MHKLEQSIYMRQPNVNFIPNPSPILRFQAEAVALSNMLKWFIKLSGLVLLSLRTLSSVPNAKLRDQITGSLMRKQIHDWGWTEKQAGGQSDEKDDQPGQQSRDTAGAEAESSQELIPASSAITKALDYHARLTDDLTKMYSGCRA